MSMLKKSVLSNVLTRTYKMVINNVEVGTLYQLNEGILEILKGGEVGKYRHGIQYKFNEETLQKMFMESKGLLLLLQDDEEAGEIDDDFKLKLRLQANCALHNCEVLKNAILYCSEFAKKSPYYQVFERVDIILQERKLPLSLNTLKLNYELSGAREAVERFFYVDDIK